MGDITIAAAMKDGITEIANILGESVEIKRAGAVQSGSRDFTSRRKSNENEVLIGSVEATFRDYTFREIDGDLIKHGDVEMALVGGGFDIEIGDFVYRGSNSIIKLRIIGVKRVTLAGVETQLQLQLRR